MDTDAAIGKGKRSQGMAAIIGQARYDTMANSTKPLRKGQKTKTKNRSEAKNKKWTANRNAGLFDLFEALLGGGSQPDIFAHLDATSREKVFSKGRRMRIAPSTSLFSQGENPAGIFQIEFGLVRTFYTSPEGREITFAYFRPGNFVGGPDIFGGNVNMWSGVAVEETQVLAFLGPDLRKLSLEFPEFGVGLLEAMIYKARCYSFMAQVLGTRSVSERVFQVLSALCNLYGVEKDGSVFISVDLSHEDLARMVGASRQWVTTTLDRLQKRNILRIRKKQIIVLRPEHFVSVAPITQSPIHSMTG